MNRSDVNFKKKDVLNDGVLRRKTEKTIALTMNSKTLLPENVLLKSLRSRLCKYTHQTKTYSGWKKDVEGSWWKDSVIRRFLWNFVAEISETKHGGP